MIKALKKWTKLIRHPYHWWDHLLFFKALKSHHQMSQGSWNHYLDLVDYLRYGMITKIEYNPIEKVFIPIWRD